MSHARFTNCEDEHDVHEWEDIYRTAEIQQDEKGFCISVEFANGERERFSVEHWQTHKAALHALKYGRWTERTFAPNGEDFVN